MIVLFLETVSNHTSFIFLVHDIPNRNGKENYGLTITVFVLGERMGGRRKVRSCLRSY